MARKVSERWVKLELEHTKSKKKAKKIVLDHMLEFVGYYPALVRMERKLKKRRG